MQIESEDEILEEMVIIQEEPSSSSFFNMRDQMLQHNITNQFNHDDFLEEEI